MDMEMPGKRRVELDELAKKGLFKVGDEPGTDTYDDGMDEAGNVVMPGSTSTEAGGNYMEDNGPRDLRHRDERATADKALERNIKDLKTIAEQNSIYSEKDKANAWLRDNDPSHPEYTGKDKKRKAA